MALYVFFVVTMLKEIVWQMAVKTTLTSRRVAYTFYNDVGHGKIVNIVECPSAAKLLGTGRVINFVYEAVVYLLICPFLLDLE